MALYHIAHIFLFHTPHQSRQAVRSRAACLLLGLIEKGKQLFHVKHLKKGDRGLIFNIGFGIL